MCSRVADEAHHFSPGDIDTGYSELFFLSLHHHHRRRCQTGMRCRPCSFRHVSIFSYSTQPTNFFSGSPLNRLAWLRTSHHFLTAVLEKPSTRWIVFKDGQPLVASRPGTRDRQLAQFATAEIRALLGPEPFFSQGQHEGELAPEGEEHKHALEAARFHGPGIVFLGLHESETGDAGALPSSDFSAKQDAHKVVDKINGTAYFSVDLSGSDEQVVSEAFQKTEAGKDGFVFTFTDGRTAMGYMDYFIGGIYASARALVDWNARNKV